MTVFVVRVIALPRITFIRLLRLVRVDSIDTRRDPFALQPFITSSFPPLSGLLNRRPGNIAFINCLFTLLETMQACISDRVLASLPVLCSRIMALTGLNRTRL